MTVHYSIGGFRNSLLIFAYLCMVFSGFGALSFSAVIGEEAVRPLVLVCILSMAVLVGTALSRR